MKRLIRMMVCVLVIMCLVSGVSVSAKTSSNSKKVKITQAERARRLDRTFKKLFKAYNKKSGKTLYVDYNFYKEDGVYCYEFVFNAQKLTCDDFYVIYKHWKNMYNDYRAAVKKYGKGYYDVAKKTAKLKHCEVNITMMSCDGVEIFNSKNGKITYDYMKEAYE